MLKAEITACPNKRMRGRELRRLIRESGVSEQSVAQSLYTSRSQIRRMEDKEWFELHPNIMQQLLDILGATSL